MSSYEVEEKLSKITQEVAGKFASGGGELDDIIKSAQQQHMLNDDEVKTLCGKVNHAVNKENFAQDKLRTFKIAKFEEILKVDRVMHPVEYKVAMYDMEGMSKAAADNGQGQNIDDVPVTPVNAALLSEAGDENIDKIKDIRSGRENEFASIKNRVVALLKEGESLDSIYAVLRDTWGENNGEELKYYFTELVNELKNDGYVSRDKEFKHDFNIGKVNDSEPLKQASYRLLKYAGEIVVREAAHEIIMDKLASNGYYEMADKLERKMPDDYYGVSCALYKGAAEMTKQAADMRAVDTRAALSSALIGGAVLGGGLALLQGAKIVNDTVRKEIWKKKLKQRYPELQQIPDARYNDLYGSIVGLEPELLRAPYALKEMIKAHDQYGTIDSSTILKLLDSGRKGNPNTPLIASAMSKGMTMSPTYVM